jgi:glucose-1-phosphate adenylyltransferase
MGIYLFKWDVLKSYLIQDETNPTSSYDFGKDIIPLLLDHDKTLYAYPFEGYWRDVGTIQSLWESNMDMLSEHPELDLNDPNWRIFTRSPNQPAQYIAPEAKVSDSIINEGCIVHGEINHSVLFFGVEVGEGSVITDSVIMPNVKIGKNVRIHRAIIDDGMVLPDGTQIGVDRDDESEILLITNESL